MRSTTLRRPSQKFGKAISTCDRRRWAIWQITAFAIQPQKPIDSEKMALLKKIEFGTDD